MPGWEGKLGVPLGAWLSPCLGHPVTLFSQHRDLCSHPMISERDERGRKRLGRRGRMFDQAWAWCIRDQPFMSYYYEYHTLKVLGKARWWVDPGSVHPWVSNTILKAIELLDLPHLYWRLAATKVMLLHATKPVLLMIKWCCPPSPKPREGMSWTLKRWSNKWAWFLLLSKCLALRCLEAELAVWLPRVLTTPCLLLWPASLI